MQNAKIISGVDFRRLQLLELDLLLELDRVCKDNGITYQIWAGTQLGAVRHKGFIPWDDDADVVMLREEYERFRKVSNQLDPNICFFQDHENDPEYRWQYGKLRRAGTKYIRLGQEHIKCKTGVFIDVFPLDDVPISIVGQMLQDFHCFLLRKILWSEVGKYSEKGLLRIWYSLLSRIPVSFVFKQIDWYAKRSRNSSSNKVRTLCYTSIGKLYYKHPLEERYGMPKRWFKRTKSFEFEGHAFSGLEDYDEYLRFSFGDYMTLPPVEQRVQHAPVSDYDFGVCSTIKLRKLSREDGKDVFEMLKGIGRVENSFTNPTYEMTFSDFQQWLAQQECWDKGEMLPEGYVAQSIYWLYDGDNPVGMGKIRHELTENSRKNGGNICYAISCPHRGKGYGYVLLKMLLEEARRIDVKEIILTIDKNNDASRKVCEKNGGVLFDENEERWFYRFE